MLGLDMEAWEEGSGVMVTQLREGGLAAASGLIPGTGAAPSSASAPELPELSELPSGLEPRLS